MAKSAFKRSFVRQPAAGLMFASANSSCRDAAFTPVTHRLLTGYFSHRLREIAEPERRREDGGNHERR